MGLGISRGKLDGFEQMVVFHGGASNFLQREMMLHVSVSGDVHRMHRECNMFKLILSVLNELNHLMVTLLLVASGTNRRSITRLSPVTPYIQERLCLGTS